MNKLFVVLFILFMFIFCQSVFAQVVSVDLSKLNSMARNEVINVNASNTAKANDVLSRDNLDKFKEFGSAIATTLKDVCQTLNVETNNFVKTPVGIVVTGLIIYKVIGKDIIKSIYTVCMCLFLYIILFTSFYIFHVPKKVKIIQGEGKDKIVTNKYIKRYEFRSAETPALSVFVHTLMFIIVTVVALI